MNDPAGLLRDPKLARLFTALAATGCEARVVGGAVRDALLGLTPKEIDVATTALPEAVAKAATAAGLKSAPTGLAHGTITIIVEKTPFEVTTLREDVETYGRAAKVRFGADFEKDALRRDFTVNALSLAPDGRLYDYTGGRDDLAARKIRFIGDPATRIAEDYLRILRFFRFHASIGDGALDRDGLHAAILARENLSILSRERVRAELLKLLAAPRAASTLREMSQAGIIEVLLGIDYPGRLERLGLVEEAAGRLPDALLRLAALAIVVREDADRLRDKLRLANAEYERLADAARLRERLHERKSPFSQQELTELLFLEGRQAVYDALTLAQAECVGTPERAVWRAAAQFIEGAQAPTFPIKGADLLALGLPPGQSLGATLKRLQARWIRAGFPRDPHKVLRLLDDAAGEE
ncbi:MAG TPA: CCA tRNA nucleotidyltransferase [Methylocystis sp.]|nr:CCA tRNA nucleotidyltransferase [Methylocystis sp.]